MNKLHGLDEYEKNRLEPHNPLPGILWRLAAIAATASCWLLAIYLQGAV